MSPLCQCTLLAQAPLARKGILTREIPYRCTLRKQGPYPRTISTKDDDDVRFILVLQCLLAFSWPCRYTLSGLRSVQRCVLLVTYPFIGFPVLSLVARSTPELSYSMLIGCSLDNVRFGQRSTRPTSPSVKCHQTSQRLAAPISALAAAPDGSGVALLSQDNAVRLVDVAARRVRRTVHGLLPAARLAADARLRCLLVYGGAAGGRVQWWAPRWVRWLALQTSGTRWEPQM